MSTLPEPLLLTLTVSEDANVTGKLTVFGNAEVTGTTTTKTLTVSEDANVTGKLTVLEDANVTGTTTTKTLTVLEDANVTGKLTVSKNAEVIGDLTVSEDAKVTGTTTTKTLTVSKNANVSGKLTVSQNAEVTGELTVFGNVKANAFNGKLTQKSSRVLKEEINDLSSHEVAAILRALNPVKFIYTEDEAKTTHAGFIAEDTPDLLTVNDKQSIKVVDIVAVLTKVVQDHRKTLTDLVKVVKKQQSQIKILMTRIIALEEKQNNVEKLVNEQKNEIVALRTRVIALEEKPNNIETQTEKVKTLENQKNQ